MNMDLQESTGNILWLILLTATLNLAFATEDSHENHDERAQHDSHEEHEEHEDALRLNEQERKENGIVIEKIKPKALSVRLSSPGEVIVNAYASTKVSPRVAAQVIARHVKLGEEVRKGQALVTLSSVDMAIAQGELLIASAEWSRVKELGRDAVSARRYTESQVAQQQAVGKVTAYGMTRSQINALLKSGDASKANGAFDLLSPQNGTIITDEFVAGELIEPGRVLFDISDESKLWVEARITPQKLIRISEGTAARVSRDGTQWIDGVVIQVRHQFDKTTRTQGIRIEVDNADDFLHPGEFVETEIFADSGPKVLAIPTSSILLLDKQQIIFTLENEEFHVEQIVTGDTIGDWTEVKDGPSAGDEVVTKGAFVLKSLLLKSQLGDGHVH
jgi:cobalt-zinc-cadmium efflux system membrane fusion protein